MIRRGLFYLLGIVLLLLCVALAGGWVRSWICQDLYYRVSVDSLGGYAHPMLVSDNGRLAFIYRDRMGPSVGVVHNLGWEHMARPHFFEFEEVRWASYRRTAPSAGSLRRTQLVVRYWLLLTISLLFLLFWFRKAMRIRRGYRAGLCSACGYDLTANASGVCPECGVRIFATKASES
jgi:hypothetical protein